MAMGLDETERVIQELYTARSLRQIIGKDSARNKAFFEALLENPTLGRKYSIAQQARSELLADEIVEIADTQNDAMKARNMIDARKWYASKMQPMKYGDRIDLNITQTVDISAALLEAKQRVSLPTCDSIDAVRPQQAELIIQNNISATGPKPVLDEIDIFS